MNAENLTPIEWPEVREGDVMLHANGDRMTVSAVDHVGYQTCKSTAGSWHSVSTLRGSGFSPYRKVDPLPTTPGAYHDKDGDYWLLDRSGNWYDWSLLDESILKGGSPQNYAPFTRLVPMPDRAMVHSTLTLVASASVEEAAAAVMALLAGEGGGDDE